MFSRSSEDKSHLAMLAIPAILSMLIGFSGDARASEVVEVRECESCIDERDTAGSEASFDDTEAQKRDLEKTVAQGDYEGFVALDTPFAELMTEPAFNELSSQYRMYKSGSGILPESVG